MRGIGWLNIIRDGAVDELLNDLRFLKNASNPAAGSVVIRNMADSELCNIYNYRFVSCADPLSPGEVVNTIWGMSVDGGSAPSETFTLDLPPETDPIAYDADAAAITLVLESAYGVGSVNVTGGPLPASVFVEFVGALAGTDVPVPPFGTDTGGTALVAQVQVGSSTVTPPFAPIDWGDGNPWGDTFTASEFLGMWVEDWEGLEGTFDRTANARGWSFGGSNFTPLRPNHLSMTFTVILAATTERGLQFGFRWLSNMLYGLDACDRSELIVFDHCPPPGIDMEDWGYWIIRDAGVLDMPRWADTIISERNCVLRRVTFVLGARDPHKYRCPVICTVPTEFEVPEPATDCAPAYSWSEWFCNDDLPPICCEFDPPPFDYSGRAAIVHILAGDDGAPPLEISFTTGGVTSVFRTTSLPAASELIIDSSRHEIRFVPSIGSPADGSGYVAAAFGYSPTWAELTPFGAFGEVCARPLRICGLDGTSVYIETVDRV